MGLERRADCSNLLGLAFDHGMRIADVDGHERDPVDGFALAHADLSDLLLDTSVREHAHGDLPRPDRDRDFDVARAAALGQPGGCDPRAVPGELGPRPVRIPDDDVCRG
jgi:hypothetical protein